MGHEMMKSLRHVATVLAIALATAGAVAQPAVAAAPADPELVSVVRDSGGMTITWIDRSTNETGFRIYHGLGASLLDGGWHVERQLSSTSTGTTGQAYVRTDTDLGQGRLHCYMVVAVNAAGQTSWSERICNAFRAPTGPTVQSVTHDYGLNRVTVTWTVSLPTEYYMVYWRLPGSSSWNTDSRKEWSRYDLPTTQSGPAEAPDGATYCYRVDAINALGTVRSGNERCLTLGPRPVAPASIDATATANSITLRWTDRTSVEDSYTLIRSPGERRLWGPLSGTTTFTDTDDISPNTEYIYSLVVRNSAGSDLVSVKVKTPGSPTPPTHETRTVSMLRQDVWEGPIPYLGTFPALGVVQPGRVLQIRVLPSSSVATVLFVKPGRSTQECANPDAVVPVDSGSTTTPEQMTAIFGQAEPRFSTFSPIRFAGCVLIPGKPPNWVNIEITIDFD
jgi:hypothetical protein